MVGGSEAPLTPFTIAQMQALKIYATEPAGKKPVYPCRALDLQKPANSMVLGEGASLACLEAGVSDRSLAIVEGIGYATEILEHNVSLSTDARCFQRSMRMALGTLTPEQVDVLVLHAPGTVKGDLAEYRAIEKVFGNKLPALTNNKWKIGHTFGASGMLSIEMAILMLRQQEFIKVPYIADPHEPETLKRVMVNAVGFGGNAVSVLLKAI
jgi:3-oxoacyl-(acyl-carrier-protein) synthase